MSLNSTTAPKVPDGQSGNIPNNAEGSSSRQAKINAAYETSLTLSALLNVCRAAAHLIEDDDGKFSKTVPAHLGKVLKHADQLVADVLVGLETAGAK
ncbi:hypothetical protein U2P60_02760 [Brucella sp. H1_1004]|uniref:hypothetical protein n=1 Tax=Brucella sp. H1_1004 TaxID=3110109 RepID=UPI0039B519D2